ncbi:myosin heavy chain kinase B-like [Clytia hemisphaerica]|uniref:myosin heavy chain kinase B-like n=1 Tax=Clytia hemisphaerica TaxID=252671 RepID=UPI0034D737D8
MKAGSGLSYEVKEPVSIKLSSFDVDISKWLYDATRLFDIEDVAFAKGAFRNVFKATCFKTKKKFVVKKFKEEFIGQLKDINELLTNKESEKSLALKAVQVHMLAKNLASQMQRRAEAKCPGEEFGEIFRYNKAFFGVVEGTNEIVMVEEFVEGEFKKYINNTGIVQHRSSNPTLVAKAECLAHFTYEKSEGKFILFYIQGSDYVLYDLEIATSDTAVSDGALKFTMGNLTDGAIKNFLSSHKCNKYCKLIELQDIK